MGSYGIEGGFGRGHDEARSNGDARFAGLITKYPVLNARNPGEGDDNMRAEIRGCLRATALRQIAAESSPRSQSATPAPPGSRATDRAMTNNTDIVFPLAARHAQAQRGSARAYEKRIAAGFHDRVTPELAAFVAELDTAFLATVSAAGAPYIQHRGGPKGFIKLLDEKTLGFADYAGNRQYITLSNLAENDRAHLFLLDFARQRRIKLWGRTR